MKSRTRNVKLKILIVALITVTIFVVSWSSVSAWTYGQPLVPCDTSANPKPCGLCDLWALAKNIIDFILIGVTPVVGTLLFILAGVYYLLGGANPGLTSRAKNIFTNTIYAIILMVLAWLIVNTIIVNLGSNVPGKWYQLTCVEPVLKFTPAPGPIGGPPPKISLPPSVSPSAPPGCDPATLSAKYNGSQGQVNAPALLNLMGCISGQVNVGGIATATYENKNPLCNYTRGNEGDVCTPDCAHALNSCHYGGATGTQGSLAVDYAVVGAKAQAIVDAAKGCGAKQPIGARCEDGGGNFVSCMSPSATHVHVTEASCDKN